VGVGRLIHNPNECAGGVSRPPEIVDSVFHEILDVEKLFLVLRADIPQFHGDILYIL
jgi:hypothetical protein